jgi:hypothetical protein
MIGRGSDNLLHVARSRLARFIGGSDIHQCFDSPVVWSSDKGKRLGRPQAMVDTARVEALRASGTSWRAISREMCIPRSTSR